MSKLPFYFLDMHVLTQDEMPLVEVRNTVYSRLHDIFADAPKHSFAVAFPELRDKFLGEHIRIFAKNEAIISQLHQQLCSHFFFRDYTKLTEIQQVPEDFDGPFVSYQRFRVPNKNASANHAERRQRRLRQAKQLPFLKVRSNSTKKEFLLPILAKSIGVADVQQNFKPNGYGIGSSENIVSLPHF